MSDQSEFGPDKRTKAMLEIVNRHAQILKELIESHKGSDLQLEVLEEHVRFNIEVRVFMGQKFQDGGIVQGKYEPVTVSLGGRSVPDFSRLAKFMR